LPKLTLAELDMMEASEYDAEELAELHRRRHEQPDKIHYILIECIYKRLGVPDPIGEACPDCRGA